MLRPKRISYAVIAAAALASSSAAAQSLADVQLPSTPLVLKSTGSFFVGGEIEKQSQTEAGGFGRYPGGRVMVNQMYVQFMVPNTKKLRVPVVMLHGGTLTGKGYETQPDGRMGWGEYFVRKNFPVYIPDQVSRGRSGFNQKIYNQVRAGETEPESLPMINRLTEEALWLQFRFGPEHKVSFEDSQFPTEVIGQFGKQAVPDMNATLPSPETPAALAKLAKQVKGAVVIGHSQSGGYPLRAALVDNKWMKGLVLIEPGTCEGYTDADIETLKSVPILTIFGDHLKIPGQLLDWTAVYEGCKAFVRRVNVAGGNAKMFHPPDEGIYGNSHMLMNDKNSDVIADRIIRWINKNVERRN